MAQTVTKQVLSGSTNGRSILVAAVASSSATPIHTAVAGASSLDEIWLYASNSATASLSCSICFGGTVNPGDVTSVVLNSNTGRTLLVDGRLLQNGLIVGAYSNIANFITIDGFINRIV